MSSPDPYTADTGYMRFHLIRMVVDKLPKCKSIDQMETFLGALAAFVSAGAEMPDEEEKEPVTAAENITVALVPGGGYI